MLTKIAKTAVSSVHIPLGLLTVFSSYMWRQQAQITDGDCYDYIIIGSGAGSVVANRLSEDKDISVLLLEAGDVSSLESMVPGLFIETQNSYQDWQYRSEKEPASQSQWEDAFKVSIGKCIGGSSNINHFIHLRGDPSDYNSWADAVNYSSWAYEKIIQYFIKSEHIDDEEIMNSKHAKLHSDTGPIIITREPYEKARIYLNAFNEVGKKTSLELIGNDTLGYTQVTLTIGNKMRQNLAVAYIKPLADRSNFHLSYKTLATKINFDEKNNAVSVDVVKHGKKITVKAAREVILSAGVIKSPQLLMISGIGPKEHLESLNIPVIKDLPVGQNMQDHVAVQLVHKMEASLEISELPTLTKIPFPIIVGAVNMNKSEPFAHYQTTNLVFTHDLPYLTLACSQLLGYKDEICDRLYTESLTRNTLFSLVAHLQPKSRGEVKLRSNDPTDSPIIFQNFYSDERDLDDMVEFLADFIGIGKSKYFKDVEAELITLDFDDCTGNFDDRNYIRCYAKHMSTSMFHQTSTCSMGKVLDSHLRVKGVQRLRVIDASVLPTITKANVLASVVMTAEKGSDMIKEDQNKLEPICKVTNADENKQSFSFEKVFNAFGAAK